MTLPEEDKRSVLKGLDTGSREMVLETVDRLRKRLLTREKVLEYDKKEIFPEETIRHMLSPEIGLQLLGIPEVYGGMGGGARDICILTREMSKICLGITTAFFAIQLGADPLIIGGTEEQKQKWLGAIANADPVVNNEGKITGYIINGAKQFISTGGYADFITLLADTPEGPAFFVVEKEAKGFIRGKGEEKHGIRASNTSPLSFTNVFVPVENLIGGVPGQGLKQANKALGILITYARQRLQFGSPLSEKQGYTHKLVVSDAVRLEAAAAYIDEIAERLDSGEEDLQVEGSIAKLFASEAANQAADHAIQGLGGYGYIAEYEVEKIRRDVRITTIYEGTSEIQQNIISTFRWKKTRKTKGEFYLSIYKEMEKLDSYLGDAGCRYYGLAAKALNDTITLVHENKLTRQQYIMFLLADMMTHVEVGASLARKCSMLMKNGGQEAEKIKVMSRIFANETAQLVINNVNKILLGSGIFEKKKSSDFMQNISYDTLMMSYMNVLGDMDRVADILFERR